jgi:hypothetical protein
MEVINGKQYIELADIIKGLKEGTITLLDSGYSCNPIIEDLEQNYKFTMDAIKDCTPDKFEGKDIKPENMIEFYKFKLRCFVNEAIPDVKGYCWDSGERLAVVLLDENTLAFYPALEFYRTKNKNKDFVLTKDMLKTNPAKDLVDAGKLVAEIEVPSGHLVFQNYFDDKALYEMQKEGYHSINDLMGRNELMQDLASRNVGYGQMGNMSVAIYTNHNDEIIVGRNHEWVEEDLDYYEEKGNTEMIQTIKDYQKTIEDGNFEYIGTISLSVWRWQCADLDVLNEYGEEPCEADPYRDCVQTQVESGTYVIEHFFDFKGDDSMLYSRIKKK